MAVPSATAVTVPPFTVATEVSLELHVTVLLVALEGATVAVSVSVLPASRSRLELLREIPVGLMISGLSTTETATVAVRPLEVFAVMVAVPFATAVIVPPATVATEVLLEDHVTDLLVASEGVIVAVIFHLYLL